MTVTAPALLRPDLEFLSSNLAELRELPQWVCWRIEIRDGKPTKVLLNPHTGEHAESNNRASWGTFDEAVESYQRNGFAGIGFVFTAADPFCGVDLDDCRNPETGVIAGWAREIFAEIDSYAEVSPSGTGVKVFCKARKPEGAGCRRAVHDQAGNIIGEVECYDNVRYFAMTGHHLAGTPTTINDAQKAVAWLCEKYLGKRPKPSHNGTQTSYTAPPGMPSATEILQVAFAGKNGADIRRLYDGDYSGYASHSEADLALTNHLAFYAGGDPQSTDLLFRQSKLMREKWDSRRNGSTYGADTIAKALDGKSEFYDWSRQNSNGAKIESTPRIETPNWMPPAAQPWPDIISFDELGLPEFPSHVLPDVLRQWVEAESHATQTPPDLPGLLSLAVCSAVIARCVEAEPRPGWREPVNLYAAVLLDPANRKSAVFSDATYPLRELEAELIEAARPSVARAQSERRQMETKLKKLEKQAAEKADDAARCGAGDLAAQLALTPVPVLPRLIVDDATSEKLGMMLAEQGGRIASMSPEGGVFDLMAGLYSKSGDPQFVIYLKGHAGDDLSTDRVTRDSVDVKRPAITCAYAIQPAVIAGLAKQPAFRGRGLLARYAYSMPVSWIGRREIAPPPVSNAIKEAYRQAVRRMAVFGPHHGSHVVTFTPEADTRLQAWEQEIENMLADGGEMEAMRDWGGKLAGLTVRLAAVIHCVEHPPAVPIGVPTVAAAIEIAHYLIPHAEAVLNMMSANEGVADDDARYLRRWIERHDRREFNKSEAQHHGKRRFPKADDIDPALAELTRRGYIRLRPAEATGPGRPPSPVYEVNSATFADAQPEMRSHNSHNSAGERESGNSGNIGSASHQSENADRVQVRV